MSHNNQKKIAVINDFSGFGRCSIVVSLPIISALKVQCCAVPTSIFSNHTGFPEFFFDDYTDKMEQYIENWKKLDLEFEGIATGFLGSKEQIDIVKRFIEDFRTEQTIVVIDPVMGDYGKPYATYTKSMCEEMRQLVSYADILTPNLTEACILTDTEYRPDLYKPGDIRKIAEKLREQGPEKVVITGIIQGEYIANYVYEDGRTDKFLKTHKVGTERSGTGDIFSSIIAADAVNGVDFETSVRKASNFIKKCILKSIEMNIPQTDGVCFEELLTALK